MGGHIQRKAIDGSAVLKNSMDKTDYEILKGQLATEVGRAVANFVNETGKEQMTVSVDVDRAAACISLDGKFQGVVSIRVYINDYDDEEEE